MTRFSAAFVVAETVFLALSCVPGLPGKVSEALLLAAIFSFGGFVGSLPFGAAHRGEEGR